MTIEVAIAGVDGETEVAIVSPNPGVALTFLRRHDHEGSQVEISIKGTNEEAYRLLEAAHNLYTQQQEIELGD